MKLLDYTITLKNPLDPITIIPFGCVHRDDPGFREHLFEQCIQEIERTPNCYAIGMGDYANFLRSTARKHLQSYVQDENSFDELDGMVKSEAIRFHKKYLSRIEKQLIGLAEGNHYHEMKNRTTDTQFLCDLANTHYLDKPAMIRLSIVGQYGANGGKSLRTLRVLKLLVHHGDWAAGYTRVGGDVNAAENKSLGFGDFDIFLFGHTHRKWAMHLPIMTIPTTGELRVVERPRVFVRTGCFMTGYDPKCQKSYAHKKLLAPTDLGYCKLTIQFYRAYEPERYRKALEAGKNAKSLGTSNWKYKFSVTY